MSDDVEVSTRGFATQVMREQMLVTFTNGYTASVVRGLGTYGFSDGLWEVAVMHGNTLVYDTPVTDDVLGYRTAEQVNQILSQIAALPPRT